MHTSLINKIVIITGASSGIGKACAIAFSKAGAKVVLASRNIDQLNDVAALIKNNGNQALVVTCDVSKEEECKNLINKTIEHYHAIDVLICNAGISMRALFTDLDLNVIRQIMDTNFWGSVYCTKYALQHLLKSRGSIVAVSSMAGKIGLPGRTGYSASKFALEGFMETVRTENLKKDLHVLVACPSFTSSNIRKRALTADGTEQGESPRKEHKMMTSDEVANSILKAVVNRKRDLLLTTMGKLTVWFNKFFPSLMDKIIYNEIAKEPGSPFKT